MPIIYQPNLLQIDIEYASRFYADQIPKQAATIFTTQSIRAPLYTNTDQSRSAQLVKQWRLPSWSFWPGCLILFKFITNNQSMGIHQSRHGYSFADQFDILRSAPARGLYKLQGRQNRELFVGRQLSCNDELQTYELECIVHQKLSNPSPFVTPLVESKSDTQNSYCSTNNKFYLLFRDVPRVLADEIAQRTALGNPFAQQQIDRVITRVTKGLTYLYNIYHHHGAVSSKAIAWPTHSNENVQLIDEWILPESQQFKRRVLRPKDEHEMNDKMQEKADDLYHLGLVAKQMMRVPDPQHSNRYDCSELMRKTQILLSSHPMDRFRIYELINNTQIHTNNTEVRKVTTVTNQPLQHIAPHQQALTVLPTQTPNNNSTPIMVNIPYQPYRKEVEKIVQSRPPATQYSNFSKQSFASPLLNSIPEPKFARPQVSFQSTTNKSQVVNLQHSSLPNSVINNAKIEEKKQKFGVRPMGGLAAFNARSGQLSASKTKVSFKSSYDKGINRTASMGKLEIAATAPPKIQTSMHEHKPNITMVTSHQFNPMNFRQQNSFKNIKQSETTLSKIQAKPLVKFNSSQPEYKLNTSNSNWVVPLALNFMEASVPPLSVTKAVDKINSSIPLTPTTQQLIEKYSRIGLNMSIPEAQSSQVPLYSGLNYSFGQSSDQTFSFKAGNSSSSDDNLFTSPDFFNKIKQSGSINLPTQKQPAPIGDSNIVNLSQNAYPLVYSNLDQNSVIKNSINPNVPPAQPGYSSNAFQQPPSIMGSYESPALPLSIKGTDRSQDYLQYSERSEGESAQQKLSRNKITEILDSIENKDVFQNVTNIPIIKSIQNPPLHDIYDKIATSHNAYEAPNIVVHAESKPSQPKEEIKKYQNQEYDYTPGKNSRSNQPFSTIPEVSERSGSVRSDDERDFVIEEYENGSRYEGFKSNGMRNGKGKFFYQEGSFYDGEWKNNNMHGYGRLYYSNNRLAYEGDWFIDQFHGRGKVYNDEPAPIFGFFDYTNFDNLDEKWKYYEGDLVCDSKEGEGKLLLSNDEYYEGQFRNDKVDGKGKFVTKTGETIKGIWEESKLVMKL